MAKLDHAQPKGINPTYIFSIISLATGIFGWVLGIFITLTGFSPLSTYFRFGRLAGLFLIISPGSENLICGEHGNSLYAVRRFDLRLLAICQPIRPNTINTAVVTQTAAG